MHVNKNTGTCHRGDVKNLKKQTLFYTRTGRPPHAACPGAVWSLYSSGRTTGLVLDSGHSATWAIPIYEGICVPGVVRRVRWMECFLGEAGRGDSP